MILCLNCRAEVPDGDYSCCPKCGSTGIPGDTEQRAKLDITQHELRILTLWATFWAEKMCDESGQKALRGILSEIRKQVPGVHLTLADEIQEVANVLGTRAELHSGDEVTEFKPETKH